MRAEPGLRARLAAEALREGLTVELPAHGVSMLPLLRPGDVLTVEPARADALRAGDVVLFERPGGVTAHRVVTTRPLVTRGDHCALSDGEMEEGALVGRVVAFRRRQIRVRLDRPFGRALSTLSALLGPLWLRVRP